MALTRGYTGLMRWGPPVEADIVDQIDAAITGLCGCGCGEPLTTDSVSAWFIDADHQQHWHRQQTTDPAAVEYSRPAPAGLATPMRWRPDLVTAADNSDLTLIGQQRRGRLNASLYRRRGASSVMHLRLDDGNRFVGADVDTSTIGGYDGTPLWDHPTWERLERDLADSRRTVPDPAYDHDGDPWADLAAMRSEMARQIDAYVLGVPGTWEHVDWQRLCVHCGQRNIPLPGQRRLPDDFEDIYSFGQARPIFRSPNVEDCDQCPTCHNAWPGPILRVERRPGMLDGTVHYRLTLGEVGHSQLVRNGEHADRELLHAEQQLMTAYAHQNPDRADVAEWDAASRRHRSAAWVEWVTAYRIAGQMATPGSILHGLSTT